MGCSSIWAAPGDRAFFDDVGARSGACYTVTLVAS